MYKRLHILVCLGMPMSNHMYKYRLNDCACMYMSTRMGMFMCVCVNMSTYSGMDACVQGCLHVRHVGDFFVLV